MTIITTFFISLNNMSIPLQYLLLSKRFQQALHK